MPRLPNLHFTRTASESKVINRLKGGAIVIAGSGMCNGGRILHHLRRDVAREETHVVFTGYQPPGTLGRRIIEGAESIRIHGETCPVGATVHPIGGFSAHADQKDLLRWYGTFEASADGSRVPVRLVHGDRGAAAALCRKLQEDGVPVATAAAGERIRL